MSRLPKEKAISIYPTFLNAKLAKEKDDKKSGLFDKVMNFSVDKIEDTFTKDDFYEYLYLPNVFEKTYKELTKGVEDSTIKYHYLRSYAKNGKSRFLQYFLKKQSEKSSTQVQKFDLSKIETSKMITIDQQIREFLARKFIKLSRLMAK